MINDFIEYWSATKLLLSGGNPYAPAELLQSQQAIGWTQPVPLFMWNPPWTFVFTLPIGLLDYGAAQFAWFLLHAVVIFVGAQVLWQIYGGDPKRSRYAWLSVLSFAPVWFVLLLGQIGPLILLGVIAFLHFVREKAWGLAGASLALATIKPQLLYLLWLALFLWILRERQWRAGVGLLVAGTAVALIPLLWNPSIYSQYVRLLQNGEALRPLDWATPSLGTAFAEFLALPAAWIRWLPSFAGALWFLWYWSNHKSTWDWIGQLPLLLLVSIVTASFAWTFDHVVLLPAVVQGAVWASNSTDQQRRPIIAVHVLLGAILLISKIFVPNDFWYFWLAPTFLIFYLVVRRSLSIGDVQTAEEADYARPV